MARTYTQDEVDLMIETVARLGNRTKAAEELGIPRTTVLNYTKGKVAGSPMGGGFNPIHLGKREGREPIDVAQRAEAAATQASMGNPAEGPVEPEPKPIEWTERGNEATATFSADRLIRTEAEALEYAEIDQSIWYVKSMEIGGWTTNMRLRAGQDADKRWRPDSGHTKQNWRISLKLARILPKSFRAAHEAIFERMKEYAPRYQPIRYVKPTTPHLLEVDLFDVHFGKLAWARETGEDYDLKIAERVFRDAVEEILSRAVGYEVERIILPVGNDFFHIDNPNNQTTNGTPQDQDGRYAKMIEVGELALIWAVEKLREVAPVDVLYVPGNHDRMSSLHAVRTLWAWFHNCPDVTVEMEPKTRKYVHYGKTLIGFTHGNEEKASSLPGIMATEEPHLWAASCYREWHRGHKHSAKRTETTPVETVDGVKIRDLQSLSGKDAWHARKGYGGGKRAAEAFLYCKRTGDTHSFDVSVRGN